MKKFYSILLVGAVLLMFSGCSSADDNIDSKIAEIQETLDSISQETNESSQLSSDAEPDNEPTNEPDEEPTNEPDEEKTLSVEEVMAEIAGEYVNSMFVEEFKNSKNIKMASKYCESVAIRNENGKYYTVIGNGHEGMSVGNVADFSYTDGKYIIQFEGYEENNLKIEYTPGKSTLYCLSESPEKSWSTNGQMIEFDKIIDKNGDTPTLIHSLFEGVKNADITDDGVYANVYDIYYKFEIIHDAVNSGINTDIYDGGLYLSSESAEDLIMQYKYENGKISLYDTADTLIKVFE